MNNSTINSHSDNFAEDGFWSAVKKYAKKIGREPLHKAFCLWLVIKDSNAPASAKATAMGALGWLISPIDAIPDLTPVVGLTDDIAVIAAAFAILAIYISDEISANANKMLPDWMQN